MAKTEDTFTAGQIAETCSGRIEAGRASVSARGICTDTRRLGRGQAFFALVGDRHDAHRFVPQALEHGAPVVVAERAGPDWPLGQGRALVLVDNTTAALARLASWHRDRLDAPVVAVTGSCGKSTVKNMIGAILARHGCCAAAPRSFNNAVGVPLSLLRASRDDDYVVLEIGANAPGEIDELAGCARPDVGVITCIGQCHLEGFGDLRGVRDAKAELVPHLPSDGVLILNRDDRLCMSTGRGYQGTIRTFGLSGSASVRPVAVTRQKTQWSFYAAGCRFTLSLPGLYNVRNAAAALAASLELGAEPQRAAGALSQFTLPPLRFHRNHTGGVTFIEDCYNSNPTAVRAVVDAFMDEPVAGRKIMVFGDMLELGPDAPRLHRSIGRHLAGQDIQMLVAVGNFGREVLRGWNRAASASRRAMRFRSAEEAWLPLWNELRPGDCVLIKGSRATGLEIITERIAEYARERAEVAA